MTRCATLRTFLFLALLVTQGTLADPPTLESPPTLPFSRAEFHGLAQLSHSLADMAKEEGAVIVTIGRSLSGVQAYLEATKLAEVHSVPLSNFRYGSISSRELNDDEKKRLFEHFDRFFPSDAELGRRKVLLADYVSSGDSQKALHRYLDEYLQQRSRKVSVLYAAPWSEDAFIGPPRGVRAIPTARVLLDRFNNEDYDDYSKYERFDLKLDGKVERTPRARYLELVRALRHHAGVGENCLRPLEILSN